MDFVAVLRNLLAAIATRGGVETRVAVASLIAYRRCYQVSAYVVVQSG
jgi:hypothetical protein